MTMRIKVGGRGNRKQVPLHLPNDGWIGVGARDFRKRRAIEDAVVERLARPAPQRVGVAMTMSERRSFEIRIAHARMPKLARVSKDTTGALMRVYVPLDELLGKIRNPVSLDFGPNSEMDGRRTVCYAVGLARGCGIPTIAV